MAVAAALLVLFGTPTRAVADEYDQIEVAVQAKGQIKEGALLMRFPRTDMHVTVRGEPVLTALGFVSWTAWKNLGDNTLLVGELVLLESEVNPVITELEKAHISVAALHNHFMWEKPRIMYLHIQGLGRGIEMARGIKAALDKTATPQGSRPHAPESPVSLDIRPLQDITGHLGVNDGGVFKIIVGRTGVTSQGMALTSVMGLHSWAGFGGTNEHAHVAGDIAMTAAEVNPVLTTLRSNGIDAVAFHNHMLDDHPRMFYLHFWGTGPAEKLAQAVRSALEQVHGPVR
jgi:hypothetical protein